MPGRVATALLAVYLIWGSTFLAMRIAVMEVPPFSLGAIRFLIAGGLLVALGRMRGEVWPAAAQLRGAIVAGLLFLGVANSAAALAMRTVPSGFAALMGATMPLLLAFWEWRMADGERPGRAVMAGLALGTAGAAVLLGPAMAGSHSLGEPGDLLIMLVGPVCWAVGTVYCRRHPLPAGLFMGSGLQTLAAGVFDLIVACGLGEPSRMVAHPAGPVAWGAIAYLVVFGSIVAYTAFTFLVRAVPPSLSSSNSYVNPAIAVILGALVLREPVTAAISVGSALVLAAVFLVSWPHWARKDPDRGSQTPDAKALG